MAQAADPIEPPSAAALLDWYDRSHRALPWRRDITPYRVWLSEIMLQQTGTVVAAPYFARFLARWPTVEALAAAEDGAVMAAWAGLGYYARARNLLACARAVAASGAFPATVEGLRALPGVGAYTAAAIAAIAFGVPVVPVDGNVERIVARVFAITAPLPGAKPALAWAAARLGEDAAAQARPGDFAQALFDLGATLCTRRPACAICPWQPGCAAAAQGTATALPARAAKRARPERFGALFYLRDAAGQVLLRRRPSAGLLGGMTELPGTAWRAEDWLEPDALARAPMPAPWRRAGEVRHVFTHFALTLAVFAAEVPTIEAEGFLRPEAALADEALPSVMRKGVQVAIGRGR